VERWRTNNEECGVFTTTGEGVMEKKASVVDMMAVTMDSTIRDAAMAHAGTNALPMPEWSVRHPSIAAAGKLDDDDEVVIPVRLVLHCRHTMLLHHRRRAWIRIIINHRHAATVQSY
jgi:hypothetical protein